MKETERAEKLTAEEIARQILAAGGTIRPTSMHDAEILLKENAKKILDFSNQENKELIELLEIIWPYARVNNELERDEAVITDANKTITYRVLKCINNE